MGIISIQGLRMIAHHGVAEQERRVGNEFEVNVSIDVPSADAAMDSDALADTINYADIVEIVKEEMNQTSKLIESVAGRIYKKLMSKYPGKIASGKVSVSKIAPPIQAQLDSVSFTYMW